jgi:hypothetical protein
LRFVAVLLATSGLAVVVLAMMAAVAVDGGRAAREWARGPVLADEGRPAVALWQGIRDSVGGVPHDVIAVQPLIDAASPPPGLPRWPAPGEVFLSPALLAAGQGEHIDTRYGRYAGLIDRAGLASPAERLAYLRPADPPAGADADRWLTVAGFGDSAITFGEGTDPVPGYQVLLAMGVLVGLPALVLLVVAARWGLADVDGRRAVRPVVVPVALGAALALVPVAIAMRAGVALPVTGYRIDPRDLRAAWPLLVGAVPAAAAVAMGVVTAAARGRRMSRRPAPARWRVVAFVVAAVAVATSSYFPGNTGLAVFAAGTVALWLFVPAAAAAVGRWYARTLLGRARRPEVAAVARDLCARPSPVVRMVSAVVVGVGLLGLLQTWTSRIGEPAEVAAAIRHHTGDRVLVVNAADLGARRVDAFTRLLPPGATALALDAADDGGDTRITGSCAAVRGLGLDCAAGEQPLRAGADVRADGIRAWFGSNTRVRVGPVADGQHAPRSLLVVAADGVDSSEWDVKRLAFATLPMPQVGTPGEDWLLGAHENVERGAWLLLLSAAGLGYLLLAAALGGAGDALRLPVAGGADAARGRIVFWYLGVPMTLAVLAGTVLAGWQGQFLVAVYPHSSFPWHAVLLAGGAAWVLAMVTCLATGVVAGLGRTRAAPGD